MSDLSVVEIDAEIVARSCIFLRFQKNIAGIFTSSRANLIQLGDLFQSLEFPVLISYFSYFLSYLWPELNPQNLNLSPKRGSMASGPE